MKTMYWIATLLFISFISPVTARAQDKQPEKQVYMIVEEMPEFPGGEKALREFIANSVRYPVVAQENGIQGRVYVSFTVDKTGMVKDAEVARGVDPSLDQEALRVVKGLPQWSPGKQKGEAVDVRYTVPIQFALDGGPGAEGTITVRETENKLHLTGSVQLIEKIAPYFKDNAQIAIAKETGTIIIDKPGTSPKEGVVVVGYKGQEQPTEEDIVFFIVEEMPEFPGGEDAMKRHIATTIKYPVEAQKKGTQGKVYVTFVVAKDGSVKDARIARGADPLLDEEAMRVVKSLPKWTPGKQRGKAVNVSYTVPIEFKLQ